MSIINKILLLVYRFHLNIYCLQTKSAEEEVRISRSQYNVSKMDTIITMISVMITGACLLHNLFCGIVHWNPDKRHIGLNNQECISLSLFNYSSRNANATIVIGQPIYVISLGYRIKEMKALNSSYKYNKLKCFYRWMSFHFIKSSKKRFSFILAHCYVNDINIKSIRHSDIKGNKLQISGNADSKKVFILQKDISSIISHQCKVYKYLIDKKIDSLKRIIKKINYFKDIKKKKPFYLIFMCFFHFQYLRKYIKILLHSKLNITRYRSLNKLKHISKSKNKNKLSHYIIIPCYNVKSHKVQVILIK